MNTKSKILHAAIQLFNQHGIANVRLQRIAQEVGISPGNLAYHFRNKKTIVETIHEDIIREAMDVLSIYRIYPNLIDFDNQLTTYFAFTQKYPFYFLDLVEFERRYPDMGTERQVHTSKMISQIRKRFDFNYNRGMIMAEPRLGVYDTVSTTIWVLITFWMPQQLLRRQATEADGILFKTMIWNQVFPYLTQDGRLEFEQLVRPLLKPQSSDQ